MKLMIRCLIIFIVIILRTFQVFAQSPYKEFITIVDGEPVKVLVIDGDTLVIANLELISVTAPREFDYSEDRDRYSKYRRYAAIVYPYAVQGLRIYKQLEKESEGKSKREKRKMIKEISGRLKDEFEEPLKNLTRTQGLILTKMMERALNKPFYEIIKELKGGFTAMYWNQLGKMYDYQLKDEYRVGKDPILDAVLEDFDVLKDLK
ncbi:MAG: DUF4294 domain-containing protein [Saprospiraceae bacterium]|uniref:DUF4294 domain-containing protein n=1 Tax=Candidatus Defluviibacterium haderslevense TaxID=2981993 RepID=A0A9D7XDE3_9BACT|nr:DUF4294 domain-containing protein [Candidatus Defluviibacterium haderslevense]MBK9716471.1 DUF4294 domain-containing protein [Candidatus Defluviibacterium haderslevense]MBL0238815.1 DUF4294 domain-containing protein [Candidatus Defluviibacterium haderslevense]